MAVEASVVVQSSAAIPMPHTVSALATLVAHWKGRDPIDFLERLALTKSLAGVLNSDHFATR